jgi:PPOX class probable F420-dependent enzyme
MTLLTTLDPTRREHVESRLRTNLMAWFTSVDPDGRPDTVPVWFLWQADGTFLVYSQPNKPKLHNLSANPNVALGLDVTDIGRDIIRFVGTAAHEPDHPPADQVAQYVAKYTERIGAIFGTAGDFATAFSAPIIIRPSRARISAPSPGATAGA